MEVGTVYSQLNVSIFVKTILFWSSKLLFDITTTVILVSFNVDAHHHVFILHKMLKFFKRISLFDERNCPTTPGALPSTGGKSSFALNDDWLAANFVLALASYSECWFRSPRDFCPCFAA
jgi:hypothetical protein